MTKLDPHCICAQVLLLAAVVSSLAPSVKARAHLSNASPQEKATARNAPDSVNGAQEKINEALADELLKMELADVSAIGEVRNAKTAAERNAPEGPIERWADVKERNANRLQEIISRYGWPGRSLVGDKASRAAFTVVQHSDHDRAFQRSCLPLMKEAGRKGEIELWEIAFLTDRLLVADGKPQLYGTQFDPCEHSLDDPDSPCSVTDPEHLDQRRKEMGLPPMDEFIKQMKQVRSRNRVKLQ
jgi:methionine-rich copper-binding protein CopC